MFNLPVFVGIDYHTKTIQVCVMDSQRKILANQSVANDPESVFRVVAPFGSNVSAAIEASTGVADFAEKLILQYHWHVELAHPGYVARMKQTPDKSDWTDAKLLADLTRAGYLPRVWLAPLYIRELRSLVRHRHGLVQQRTQAKLRLRAALRNDRVVCPYSPWTIKGKKWLLDKKNIESETLLYLLQEHYDTVEFFDKKIGDVTERMQVAVADDPVVKQLLRQPGVGMITAITLRALVGHFDRFRTGKQLAHFCAVCPRNNSRGGKATTGGIIKSGDDMLRGVLIESAHRLIRYNEHWKAMAARLRANGKKTCVIIAAVANRWMRWLFRQMMDAQQSLTATPA
jgi:transposase